MLSWKDIVKMLHKVGYDFKRHGKGDHLIYSIESPKSGLGMISIPRHDEIDPGTLKSILDIVIDHTGISMKSLIEMLK